MAVLCVNKRLNESVCGLSVEGEGVIEGLEFDGLVKESVLEALAVTVEVLLDGV